MRPPDGIPLHDVDDAELMRLAGIGRLDAFEALVRRHQQPLLNFFVRMGAHRDAEDRVQETLVRVFNYRSRYKPSAKFTTFLYTLARHVWIDALRKVKRAEAFTERFRAETPGSHDGGMGNAQLRMDLQAALERLPEKLRSVVVLAVYQGLGYEEVAGILAVPVGTVKSRMFLAVGQLREVFGENEH